VNEGKDILRRKANSHVTSKGSRSPCLLLLDRHRVRNLASSIVGGAEKGRGPKSAWRKVHEASLPTRPDCRPNAGWASHAARDSVRRRKPLLRNNPLGGRGDLRLADRFGNIASQLTQSSTRSGRPHVRKGQLYDKVYKRFKPPPVPGARTARSRNILPCTNNKPWASLRGHVVPGFTRPIQVSPNGKKPDGTSHIAGHGDLPITDPPGGRCLPRAHGVVKHRRRL